MDWVAWKGKESWFWHPECFYRLNVVGDELME